MPASTAVRHDFNALDKIDTLEDILRRTRNRLQFFRHAAEGLALFADANEVPPAVFEGLADLLDETSAQLKPFGPDEEKDSAR